MSDGSYSRMFDLQEPEVAKPPTLRMLLAGFCRRLGLLSTATIMLCAIMVVTAIGLYEYKHEAKQRRADIADMRSKIVEHREAIDLLDAEWTYLNRPERIQALAERFLNLQTFKMEQMVDADSLAIRPDPAPRSIEDILAGVN